MLDCPALYAELGGHMIFFEDADGRICIVFPYLGKVLAGSTDIRVEAAGRVRCERDEQEYILNALRGVFPEIPVSADDIVFSYSGIRPLPKSDHEFTGRIPRSHFLRRVDGPVPQICMVGGKWTTFRAFAEQAADAVLVELGRPRVKDTLTLAIGGGAGFPDDPGALQTSLVKRHAIGDERAAYLADAYGTRAEDVLSFCLGRSDDRPIGPCVSTTAAEIVFLIRNEYVVCLEDVLLRRTPLAIRGDISSALIDHVAEVMADEIGWSRERRDREVETFIADLGNYHGVSRDTLDKRTLDRSLTCD
jgi:glycerol-3-phosphate dehydrogenase